MNSKLKSALIGGSVFGTASALPYLENVNALCCALIIGAGVLAAYLHFKDMDPISGRMGQGALVGLLAGVFGALATTIVTVIVTAAGLKEGQSAELAAMFESLGVSLPPELASMMDDATEVSGGMIVYTLLTNLVTYAIFSTIGGLVGAAMFAKKSEDAT